ncbi:MAG TPA: nuclear transport factor 2 family protein [Kofleriaceae bacterium]|nr:nuclear transport factor 2 family protein [Kofleriaceae bacterium]
MPASCHREVPADSYVGERCARREQGSYSGACGDRTGRSWSPAEETEENDESGPGGPVGTPPERKLSTITAQAFKDAIGSRPSLASRGARREDQILLVDLASPTQALVKVRAGWNAAMYVDYLTYHRIDGEWLITAKGFHIER